MGSGLGFGFGFGFGSGLGSGLGLELGLGFGCRLGLGFWFRFRLASPEPVRPQYAQARRRAAQPPAAAWVHIGLQPGCMGLQPRHLGSLQLGPEQRGPP